MRSAHEKIKKEMDRKKINKDQELKLQILKSEIECYFGNFKESFSLADRVSKESEDSDNELLQVDAFIWKAVSSFWDGEFNESQKFIEKGLSLISKVKKLQEKEILKRQAQLLLWQSYIISHLGDFNKGLDLGEKALSLAEKSGYKNVLFQSLISVGEANLKLFDIKRTDDIMKKAQKLANDLGNKFYLAFTYGILANNYWYKRNFDQAQKLYNELFDLAEEIGCKILFVYYVDAGALSNALFQLDDAIEYFQKALKYSPFSKYLTYAHMGTSYHMKNNFKQAEECYLKQVKFSEEMKSRFIYPRTLYSLVQISLEQNNSIKAKEYLKQLKELAKETDFEHIIRYYNFASILVLKASSSVHDLALAVDKLNTILEKEHKIPIWRLEALYSLLEIRIKELQLTPNEEALEEVQKRLYHLEIEAEEQKAHWLLGDVIRLQSLHALISLDINKAITLLNKAQTIADEIGIKLLNNEIKKDREKIDQQLSMLQKLKEQNAPISETLKLISLESTVKTIKQETILEERDEETGKIIEYRKLFALKI